MKTVPISEGALHKLPKDLKSALVDFPKAHVTWETITPLARNEYVCWVENAKQTETRQRRVRRTIEQLVAGKRRPCCWMGCMHRPDGPKPYVKIKT